MTDKDILAGDIQTEKGDVKALEVTTVFGENDVQSVTVETGGEVVQEVEAPYYGGGGGSVPVISVEANSLPAGSDATATITSLTSGLAGKVDVSVYEAKIKAL